MGASSLSRLPCLTPSAMLSSSSKGIPQLFQAMWETKAFWWAWTVPGASIGVQEVVVGVYQSSDSDGALTLITVVVPKEEGA